MDYDHGTGHGVGSFLGVHEGPQRIGKAANAVALKPGMIVSNEPGYYKTGAYGIRLENLVTVVEGRLDDGKTSVDVIRATFPGGSITGCPKIRSHGDERVWRPGSLPGWRPDH